MEEGRLTHGGNLPAPISSFVGRQRDLTQVRELLAAHRLVTLVGAGGLGKTRLSIEAGRQLAGRFRDGSWLVELAAVTDPARIPRAVLGVLHHGHQAPGETLEALTEYLRERELLLLLDNCEHLLEACAELALHLLQRCPNLRILATSRAPLATPGEVIWRIQPLLPAEAVQLFVERIRAVQPAFAVTPENAGALQEICIRLDGVPLALELAAARTKVLTVEQIAARLDDRFSLLTAGARTTLPRQQTLRALLDWSFDLLSPAEQRFFRRLAVFRGGWSLEALEVVSGEEPEEPLDLLSRLVDHSLVMTVDSRATLRYDMLETVRQYAEAKLRQADEEAEMRHRHLRWLLRWVGELPPGLSQPARWQYLNAELDNARTGMAWALGEGDDPEAAARLCTGLQEIWAENGHILEGRRWLEAILETGERLSPSLRVRLLLDVAHLAVFQRDIPVVERVARQALQLSEAAGDLRGAAEALTRLCVAAETRGDHEPGRQLAERALALARQTGYVGLQTRILNNLGVRATARREWEQAEAYLQESAALCRQIGFLSGLEFVLSNLAELFIRQGRIPEAEAVQAERVEVHRQLGISRPATYMEREAALAYIKGEYQRCLELSHELLTMMNIGHYSQTRHEVEIILALAHLRLGDAARATALLRQAVERVLREGWSEGYLPVAEYALLALEQQDWRKAAYLSGVLMGMGKRYWGSDWNLEAAQPDLRERLSEPDYQAALTAGQSASVEELVAICLGRAEVPDRSPKGEPPPLPAGLTAREVEVITLVAQGLTDREVAEQLFIAPRTVETHLRNIYNKAGVSNRAALVAFALRQGLVK